MFDRRRQNRKLVRVARMLRELDACATRRAPAAAPSTTYQLRLNRAA